MALQAYVEGFRFVLLLVCLSASAADGYGPYRGRAYHYYPSRPREASSYYYRRHEDSCEVLEARFLGQCARLAEQLDDNDCLPSCGSVAGQQCQLGSEPCTEVPGLCTRGKKCCTHTTTQPPTTTTTTTTTTQSGPQCNFGAFQCLERESCEDLDFGTVNDGLGGCPPNLVCCNTPCPESRPPPSGAPPGTNAARCEVSGTCDANGQYPTLENEYICVQDPSAACCLVRVN